MKQTKQAIAILLAVLLLALSMPFAAVAAESGTYQGFSWTLSDDGVLTISGEGELQRPNNERSVGWHRYRSQIKSVVVESGVTGMTGSNLFSNCPNLTSLSLPLSLTAVGSAFRSVSTITAIIYEGTQEDWNQITGTNSIPNLSNIEIAVHIHVYDDPAEEDWEWTAADDSYTVTVTVTCSLCAESVTGHEKELTATVEQTAEVPATHLENGSKTFTATATVGEDENAQTFTDTKTDDIQAEGHSYGEWIPEEPATCSSEGTVGHYYCSGCETYFDAEYNELETVTIEKEPHEWDYESDSVTYTWDGFTACTATVPCKNCTETNDVTTSDISSETTTAPTCQATGIETYTAVFEESEALLAETTDVLPMVPHTFVSDPYFAEEDGTWYAFGLCSKHMSSIVKEEATWKTKTGATCTDAEVGYYEAVINGVSYESEEMEKGDPLPHNYQFDSFVWSADNTTAQVKLVCSRCEAESTAPATVTSEMMDATCTSAAKTVYTAKYQGNEDTKEVSTGNALGHDFDSNPRPVYNEDGATHTVTCARCPETKSVKCFNDDTTGWSQDNATCTEPGTVTRSCPVCNHEYSKQTPALGHDYGTVTHFAPDSSNYVKAQVPCSRCDGVTERKPVETSVDAPTCTTAGTKYWFVKFDNAIFNDEGKDSYLVKSETIEIDPDAHSYAFTGFTWATGEDGAVTATANFTCTYDETHTTTQEATVTKDENASVDATCAAAGKAVYNASVVFEDETYTTGTEDNPAYEVTLEKVPHVYGDPTWDWTDDTTATATFVCENCDAADAEGNPVDGHSVTLDAVVTTSTEEGDTVPATCTVPGSHKNIATVMFGGETYSDPNTITDAANGHTYGAPEWTWSGNDEDGYTKATATFTCTVETCTEAEEGHTAEVECTTENEGLAVTTTPAKHLVDGKTIYTATAVFEDASYTAEKEVAIAAAGHTVETVGNKDATCETAGNKAYTYCSVCNVILSIDGEDVESEGYTVSGSIDQYTIPASGHTYSAPAKTDWTWTPVENGYTATVVVSCEKEDDTKTLTATVELTDSVERGHTTNGFKTYTATATIGKQTFTDTHTDTFEAPGHTVKTVGTKDATCETAGNKAYTYCSVCDVILSIDGENVESEGYTFTGNSEVYTIAASGHKWGAWKKISSEEHQRVCENDKSHVQTERHNVETTIQKTVDPLYPEVTNCQEVDYCRYCNEVLGYGDSWQETAPHLHEYTSETTREPNCSTEGEITYTCTLCGFEKTDTIPTNDDHVDADNNGLCDRCEKMMEGGDHCPRCGKIHNGNFFDKLTGFFHRIAAAFARLFG